MIEILRHAAFTFFRTKEANKFIEENKISLPETLLQTLRGWKFDSSGSKTPELNLETSLLPFIRKAKKSIEKICQYADVTKSLLAMEETEVLEISQVVLVHSLDDGKDIPVINRFCVNNDTVATTDLSETIRIPSEEEMKEKDPDNPLLGCYILQTGTILLWIDRIFRERTTINGNLLFQMVLLHELIHALFDCADRDINHVYLNEPKRIKDFEETLDNLLVLKCYEACDKGFFDSVYAFICSQSGPYRLAAPLFDLSRELGWTNKDYSSRISTLLYFKVQPNQTSSLNNIFKLYTISCSEEEKYDFSSGLRIEDSFVLVNGKCIENNLPYIKNEEKHPKNETTGMYVYSFLCDICASNKRDLILKNVVFSIFIEDTTMKQEILTQKAAISFQFFCKKTKKTKLVYYLVMENNEYVDKFYDPDKVLTAINSSVHYWISHIILTVNPESDVACIFRSISECQEQERIEYLLKELYSNSEETK